MISPLSSTDDFARQLSPDELMTLADQLVPQRDLLVCAAIPDGITALRAQLGEPRVDAVLRELTLFVRRNLRGVDAIAAVGDELLMLIDAPTMLASAIADRILGAVRSHVFEGGTSDHAVRLTLSMGIAPAPQREARTAERLVRARQVRAAVGGDGYRIVDAHPQERLELGRFVGRAEQLARLTSYLDDVVRGVGRVVAVIGERGVGASALVRTLQPEVRLRGGSLVVGSCHAELLTAPHALWADVLRGIRRLPVRSTRLWRELPLLDPGLENASDEKAGGSKTHLLEELADFLRLAAQQRPLVLLLEDLQWADAASWDALEYLVTQLESERILIALTFATSTADDDALERWRRLSGRTRHHEMQLTGLTREDAKHWLEGAMRTADPGRELLAHLYRHSEGNPLLLTQLIRDLQESGHIAWQHDGWQTGPIASFPPHVDLETLIARRIGRLDAAPRAMLDALAVLGRGAVEPLVADMAQLDAASGHAALGQLIDRGMLVPSFDRDQPSYAIVHEELAGVARALLPASRRAQLHVTVATALAARRAGSSAEIAGHFDRAGDSTQAHDFAIAAADEALAIHEGAAAADFFAIAERTAPSPGQLAEVRVRMASLAELANRYEDAEALADLALAWYTAQGDQVKAVQVSRTRTLVRMMRGRGAAETLADLLVLEQDAVRAGAESERAAVLLLVGQMHWRLGDFRSAKRVAEEAVAIAERGDDQALLADACNRVAVTIVMEDSARARELYAKSLEIATALGDPFRRIRCLNNLGVLELHSHNWDEARRVLTMAAEQSRTAGLLESWGRAELNLGVLEGRIGDYDGAARALSEALRITSMVQSSADQLYATYNMAHVERERGRIREAGDLYDLVSELAARIGQVEVQVGAQSGLGLCRLMLGDVEGARRALAATNPLTEPLVEWFQGREIEIALRVELLLADAQVEEAAALFERSLGVAAVTDEFGSAWLTAEFGERLRGVIPGVVAAAVARYSSLPEVVDNPRIRERFAVLNFDSNVPIDRIA